MALPPQHRAPGDTPVWRQEQPPTSVADPCIARTPGLAHLVHPARTPVPVGSGRRRRGPFRAARRQPDPGTGARSGQTYDPMTTWSTPATGRVLVRPMRNGASASRGRPLLLVRSCLGPPRPVESCWDDPSGAMVPQPVTGCRRAETGEFGKLRRSGVLPGCRSAARRVPEACPGDHRASRRPEELGLSGHKVIQARGTDEGGHGRGPYRSEEGGSDGSQPGSVAV